MVCSLTAPLSVYLIRVRAEEVKKSGDVKIPQRRSKQKVWPQRIRTIQNTLTSGIQSDKPLTIRQHALQSALNPASRSPSPEPLPHVKEQELLRKETISAFHTAVDGRDDEEEDDLLVLREKTKDELEREEEEYREFLQREVGEDLGELIKRQLEDSDDGAGQKDLEEEEREKAEKTKKKAKKDKHKEKATDGAKKSKAEDDQEFLLRSVSLSRILHIHAPLTQKAISYILNRGWIDRSTKRLPTYKEVTGSSKSKGKGRARADMDDSADEEGQNHVSGSEAGSGQDLEEDVEFEEVADLFESSYNFRFEEPYVVTAIDIVLC